MLEPLRYLLTAASTLIRPPPEPHGFAPSHRFNTSALQHCSSWLCIFWLRATGYGLRATGYGLLATGYRLLVAVCRVPCTMCCLPFDACVCVCVCLAVHVSVVSLRLAQGRHKYGDGTEVIRVRSLAAYGQRTIVSRSGTGFGSRGGSEYLPQASAGSGMQAPCCLSPAFVVCPGDKPPGEFRVRPEPVLDKGTGA